MAGWGDIGVELEHTEKQSIRAAAPFAGALCIKRWVVGRTSGFKADLDRLSGP